MAELREDYAHGPYEAYCARLELMLHDLKAKGVKRLSLTPIQIDDYLASCHQRDHDPQRSDTRASYSTTLLDRDIAEPWPPQRNESCWCGSERKCKKCCGLVHARSATVHTPAGGIDIRSSENRETRGRRRRR